VNTELVLKAKSQRQIFNLSIKWIDSVPCLFLHLIPGNQDRREQIPKNNRSGSLGVFYPIALTKIIDSSPISKFKINLMIKSNAIQMIIFGHRKNNIFIIGYHNINKMKKNIILILVVGFCILSDGLTAQTDSTAASAIKLLTGNIKLQVDTIAPPEDSLTIKIRLFRSERGPVNFDNVIKLSIQEKQAKDTTLPKEYYDLLLKECQHGSAHLQIESILINLYRMCFTEQEIDQLREFYKTSAGKKMFINILMISATAAPAIEKIVKVTADKLDEEMKAEGKKK
jgi:hypothetical protein